MIATGVVDLKDADGNWTTVGLRRRMLVRAKVREKGKSGEKDLKL